ncbi:MAG: hypothetical protein KH230_13760 [Enterocloster asparagiformis]|nr:hypothetical protein [Enterocloster asparagiformis]
MSDKEKIDKWIADHDGEDYCKYCQYDDECPHGMACYGGDPVEPPCCSNDIKELLDIDTILEDLESEEN